MPSQLHLSAAMPTLLEVVAYPFRPACLKHLRYLTKITHPKFPTAFGSNSAVG
jgi:hypothetical protein